MFNLFYRYRDPLVVLLLFVLPLAAYLSDPHSVRNHNFVDRASATAATPMQWLTVAVVDTLTRSWRRYVALAGAAEENERLRAEVAALKEELGELKEDRLENERLHLLVELKERAPNVPMIAARVISTAPTPLFRALRINKGSRHGVQVGSAVVVHDGVVGRVAALSAFSSDVMLIVDTNSSIDVLVQRTRARARVRGEGGDAGMSLVSEHLARTADVEPGDVLVTSGTGETFPKGLAVGTVLALTRGAFGLYQHARAEPSVDFSRLEEVMVIPLGFPKDAGFAAGDLLAPTATDGEATPP